MALPVEQQVKYWSIAFAVFLATMWVLNSVLTPFIVGGAIAYFLDPVADRLQRLGLSRVAATTIISLTALLIAVLLMLAVIPALAQQLSALMNIAPEMFRKLQAFLTSHFPQLLDDKSVVRQTLVSFGETIQSKGGELARTLFSSALGVINALVFMVVVPVVSFYLLLDWDNMVGKVDALLPRDHAETIRELARRIDKVLAAFVRGQISVCMAMGLFYSIALMVAGLEFGLIVGAIAGAITFIPYVGALVGGALAIGLALFQFWGDPLSIGIVVAIFVLGQFLEGNVVTPRLVGNSVGLHPVWLLFALSAFGAAFGFVGMLVAVPVAASIGVFARFGIERYQLSLLYRGLYRDDENAGSEQSGKDKP